MRHEKEPIRIKLTPTQQKLVRKACGKKADAIELSVEELEERIAPARFGLPERPDKPPVK